ncbi:MAG: hypothetical protein NT027_04045 [Proteobacteria bacterium]|nr:hypothetical protein [Pseudomonadota bacterium]
MQQKLNSNLKIAVFYQKIFLMMFALIPLFIIASIFIRRSNIAEADSVSFLCVFISLGLMISLCWMHFCYLLLKGSGKNADFDLALAPTYRKFGGLSRKKRVIPILIFISFLTLFFLVLFIDLVFLRPDRWNDPQFDWLPYAVGGLSLLFASALPSIWFLSKAMHHVKR